MVRQKRSIQMLSFAQTLVEKVLTHRPRARRGMFHIEPVHLLHRFFVFWSFALGLVVDGVAADPQKLALFRFFTLTHALNSRVHYTTSSRAQSGNGPSASLRGECQRR